MPRKAGTPKTGGRKAGTPNKTPEQIRTALLKFIAENLDGVTMDFKKMDADKRLIFFEKIIRHILPAPTSFERLSDEQLSQLHSYLKRKYIHEQE